MKITTVFLAKADGLIADKKTRFCVRQARGHDRLAACAPQNISNQTRIHQSEFFEKTTQQIDRSLRRRIELDFFDLGNVAVVRDNDAVNRAVG